MHNRGDPPHRAASHASGLRMPGSGTIARVSENTVIVGLDLLMPLALALGSPELNTQTIAARQVQDLARQGKVSCAAAQKTGTVTALINLATRESNTDAVGGARGLDLGERSTTSGNAEKNENSKDSDDALECAVQALGALTTLVLCDPDGKRLVASAATIGPALEAIEQIGRRIDYARGVASKSASGDNHEVRVHLPEMFKRAHVSLVKLLFALASTTSIRVALAAHRGALAALADWTRADAFCGSDVAANAAGVLWVAATPPLPDNNVSPSDTHRRTESGEYASVSGTSTPKGGVADRRVGRSHVGVTDASTDDAQQISTRNSTFASVGVGGGAGGGGGGGPKPTTINPSAVAAAKDVADALARRHLKQLASAVGGNGDKNTVNDDSNQTENALKNEIATTRRRVYLLVASVAGRDAARAAAVSRETTLIHSIVKSLHTNCSIDERNAAATALWRIVSGVLSSVSVAARAVIDSLVDSTDVVPLLALALAGAEEGISDTQKTSEMLRRTSCAILGTIRDLPSFEKKVVSPFFRDDGPLFTPIGFVIQCANASVGMHSNVWAMWCLRELTSVSCLIAEIVANDAQLSRGIARATAGGGDAGVLAAGVTLACLTSSLPDTHAEHVHTVTSIRDYYNHTGKQSSSTPAFVRAFALSLVERGVPGDGLAHTKCSPETPNHGDYLAHVLSSLIKRSVDIDTRCDGVDRHANSVHHTPRGHNASASFDLYEVLGIGGMGGPKSVGAGEPLSSKLTRFQDRQRSRTQSGELSFWGSNVGLNEWDMNSDGPGSYESNGQYTPTSRTSFGTVVMHSVVGRNSTGYEGRFEKAPKSRLVFEAKRLSSAIVSGILKAVEGGDDERRDMSSDDAKRSENAASSSTTTTTTTTVDLLLQGGLPKLLLGCVCHGDGDDETGAYWYSVTDRNNSSREGFSIGTTHVPALSTTTAPSFMASYPKTIHASAAHAIGVFMKRAGAGMSEQSGENMFTRVMTDPGEGLLLAVAAVLGSKDAQASRKVAEALGEVLQGQLSYGQTVIKAKTKSTQSLAQIVCSFPGVVDGLTRAVWFGIIEEVVPLSNRSVGYGQTVGGTAGLTAYDSTRDQTRINAHTRSDSLASLNDDEGNQNQITVPLPATPKDELSESKQWTSNTSLDGSIPLPQRERTESALDRSIPLPDNALNESFVSAGSDAQPLSTSLVSVSETTDSKSNLAGRLSSSGNLRSLSLRVPFSPSGRRSNHGGGWMSHGGCWEFPLGSPRGGVASLRRGRLSAREEQHEVHLHRERMKWRTFSSPTQLLESAIASVTTIAGLINSDGSGQNATLFATHKDLGKALSKVFSKQFLDKKEKENNHVGLLAACAALLTLFVKRGEGDRVMEVVFFGNDNSMETNSGPGSFADVSESLTLENSGSMKRVNDTLDCLLEIATGASRELPSPGESAIHASVHAATALASVANNKKVAHAMTTHGKVIPQLLALTAPLHDPKIARAAANALCSVLVASPPPPGSDAAETVWSVDAVTVLVSAMRRVVDLDSTLYGRDFDQQSQTVRSDVQASAAGASAASARLFSILAASAEDDASREDIAEEPGVLSTVEALLHWKDRGSSTGTNGFVTASVARVVTELARTPKLLESARTELGGTQNIGIVSGLLNALLEQEATEPCEFENDDSLDVFLGAHDAQVASMCALSRLAAADADVAFALFENKRFMSFANGAIAAAAALAKSHKPEAGGGGEGVPLDDKAQHSNSRALLIAGHCASALGAWTRARTAGQRGSSDSPDKSLREMFTDQTIRDLTAIVAGFVYDSGPESKQADLVPPRSHSTPVSRTTAFESHTDKRTSSLKQKVEAPKGKSLLARRGAGALATLAVGESEESIPVSSIAGNIKRRRGRVADAEHTDLVHGEIAVLSARLGAARALRGLFSAAEIGEARFPDVIRAFIALLTSGDVINLDRGGDGLVTASLASLVSSTVRVTCEFLRDCLLVEKVSSTVAGIVADDRNGTAAKALVRAIGRIDENFGRLIAHRNGTTKGSSTQSTRTPQHLSSPKYGTKARHSRTPSSFEIGPESFRKSEMDDKTKKKVSSRDNVFAATAALAVVAAVARREPRFVGKIAAVPNVGICLSGFLDKNNFQRACDTSGTTLLVSSKDDELFSADSYAQTVIPSPFSRGNVVHSVQPPASIHVSITLGDIHNARLVAADIFAAVAAVAAASVVASDPRAAIGLAEVVGGGNGIQTEHAYSAVHRTAAARALWSLSLADGDGAHVVGLTRGATAALAGLLVERDATDETDPKSAHSSARAAAAGALGALFSGAVASFDLKRAVRCVSDAFDVDGCLTGFASVMLGSDNDGALASAAATAAATRVPLGAKRIAESEELVQSLCTTAVDDSYAQSDTNRRDTIAHALDALINLVAHTVSVEAMMAPESEQMSFWLVATARLLSSERNDTKLAAITGLRTLLQTGQAMSQSNLSVVNKRALSFITLPAITAIVRGMGDQSETNSIGNQPKANDLDRRVAALGCLSLLANWENEFIFSGKDFQSIAGALSTVFQFVRTAGGTATEQGDSPGKAGSQSKETKQKIRLLTRLAASALRGACFGVWKVSEESSTINETVIVLANTVREAADWWSVGGADSASASSVAEALAVLARNASKDQQESLKRALASAATSAAPALVAAVVATTEQLVRTTTQATQNVKVALSAATAITALAEFSPVCVEPFFVDPKRRDALVKVLASVLKIQEEIQKEDKTSSGAESTDPKGTAFASVLRALAGTSKPWAKCVSNISFDALIDRVRFANLRDTKHEANLVDPNDVDVTMNNFSFPHHSWHSIDSIAASTLRRLLVFRVLDEAQVLALLAPSFGVIDGVKDLSKKIKTSARVGRFILGGGELGDEKTDEITVPTKAVRLAVARTLSVFADSSRTAARVVAKLKSEL